MADEPESRKQTKRTVFEYDAGAQVTSDGKHLVYSPYHTSQNNNPHFAGSLNERIFKQHQKS